MGEMWSTGIGYYRNWFVNRMSHWSSHSNSGVEILGGWPNQWIQRFGAEKLVGEWQNGSKSNRLGFGFVGQFDRRRYSQILTATWAAIACVHAIRNATDYRPTVDERSTDPDKCQVRMTFWALNRFANGISVNEQFSFRIIVMGTNEKLTVNIHVDQLMDTIASNCTNVERLELR